MPTEEVTWRNQFLSRYRCRDCSLRFWVISHKSYVVAATLLATFLVAALAVFVLVIALDPEGSSVPSQPSSEAVPLPHPVEVVHPLAATFSTSARS
jgi:hypothetical protein